MIDDFLESALLPNPEEAQIVKHSCPALHPLSTSPNGIQLNTPEFSFTSIKNQSLLISASVIAKILQHTQKAAKIWDIKIENVDQSQIISKLPSEKESEQRPTTPANQLQQSIPSPDLFCYALACNTWKLETLVREKGNNDARAQLGSNFFYGHYVSRNIIYGIKLLNDAARSEGCSGNWARGICMLEGIDKKIIKRHYLVYFIKAAEQDYAPAQYSLGNCYQNGIDGQAPNLLLAEDWYKKSAEQDYPPAQHDLGMLYFNSSFKNGIITDPAKAAQSIKWLTKAAENGHMRTQCFLGSCYAEGKIVNLDYPISAQWFLQAALLGYAPAQYSIALCYEIGKGVSQNISDAIYWYDKAAKHSNMTNAQAKRKELLATGDEETKKTVSKKREQSSKTYPETYSAFFSQNTDEFLKSETDTKDIKRPRI